MNNSTQKETGGGLNLIRHAAVGALIGMLVTLLVMLLGSMAMTSKLLPTSIRDLLVLASVIIGTMIGGIYCAKKQGRGVITAGLVTAVVYIILLLLGTMLCVKKGGESSLTLKIIIAAVAGGCFGGVLRLGRKTTKSRLRKKYN